MNNLKIKLSSIYICFFTIAFISTDTFLGLKVNYWIKYIIGFIWILICAFYINNDKEKTLLLKKYFAFFIAPFVIMLIHMPFAYLIQEQTFNYATFLRITSYFLQRCILILVPILTSIVFKKKAIKYTFTALVINYTMVIIYAILKFGFTSFLNFIFTAWKSEWNQWQASTSIAGVLEVHDLTFTLGFFVLYFLLFSNKKHLNNKTSLLICVLYMWLGFKRIELLAILVCILMAMFINKKGNKTQIFKIRFFSMCVIFVLLGYVFIIKDSEIINLANKYNINFNGRLGSYEILSKFYDFSPLFFGRGYCFSTLLIDNIPNLNIIHSDILKSFIDYGFIGFILWISYYTYMVPRKLYKEKSNTGIKASIIFFVFSVYSMIIYLTDNTNVYFCYQISYLLIPLSILIQGSQDEKLKLKNSEYDEVK